MKASQPFVGFVLLMLIILMGIAVFQREYSTKTLNEPRANTRPN